MIGLAVKRTKKSTKRSSATDPAARRRPPGDAQAAPRGGAEHEWRRRRTSDEEPTTKPDDAAMRPRPTARRTAEPSRRAEAAGHGPVDGRQAARYLRQRVLRQEPPPAGLRQPAQGAADDGQGSGRQLARRLRRGRHPARDLGPHRSRPAPTASRSACRTTAPASSRSRSR